MKENPFDLTGKVAIVTGTSRGLGQSFARALAQAGADLVITSRESKSLAPFQAEIEALGRRALQPLASLLASLLAIVLAEEVRGRQPGGNWALPNHL